MLLDDPKDELFSTLMKDKDKYPVLYDFDLMMNGGHIKGYAIEKENADQLESKIAQMQQKKELFLSVGDGNHSLATAKACWEEIKRIESTGTRKSSGTICDGGNGQPV